MTQPVMRRFETVVYRDRSGTDPAQVPAQATLEFFRQGATASSTVTVPVMALDFAIPVYATGRIVVGDNLKVSPGSSATPLQVSEVVGGGRPPSRSPTRARPPWWCRRASG